MQSERMTFSTVCVDAGYYQFPTAPLTPYGLAARVLLVIAAAITLRAPVGDLSLRSNVPLESA